MLFSAPLIISNEGEDVVHSIHRHTIWPRTYMLLSMWDSFKVNLKWFIVIDISHQH